MVHVLFSKPQAIPADRTRKSPIIENHNISCIQGFSAGPETYSLYTADIESITNLFSIYFADDTNIINSGKDLKKIESEMNEAGNFLIWAELS